MWPGAFPPLFHSLCSSFQLRAGAECKPFESDAELAAVFQLFTTAKFAATSREEHRGALPDIGSAESRAGDVPCDSDLELCLHALADAKRHGLDTVSVEA